MCVQNTYLCSAPQSLRLEWIAGFVLGRAQGSTPPPQPLQTTTAHVSAARAIHAHATYHRHTPHTTHHTPHTTHHTPHTTHTCMHAHTHVHAHMANVDKSGVSKWGQHNLESGVSTTWKVALGQHILQTWMKVGSVRRWLRSHQQPQDWRRRTGGAGLGV